MKSKFFAFSYNPLLDYSIKGIKMSLTNMTYIDFFVKIHIIYGNEKGSQNRLQR